ncbi:hypothetical protein SUDANB120_05666 [Streptomyces sp. enrichment culture]|uniref:MAB_1171c family putative transporter n=1 Tax=Streptomyces TaxID=1883 RepID=UPI00167955B8|nr:MULTISPECIES: MAB_1171c family putative transporter [Streptomyces]MBD3575740.1 hypothetical protein [Streptomyces sp. KD18]GGT25692.1 hypothetical protein GCM10010286_58890 [Streptomyces toxytricini]
MMRGSDYFIPATAMALALAAKLPTLLRGWRSPMVRSVCALIATGASSWFFAAPPVVERVNRWTGVPNASAPLVYSLVVSFSCASLVLILHWRGGPPRTQRRQALGWIAGTAAVITALAVLFALGDAPVERRQDFDTHYARTPFIRELIIVYLAAHTGAALVVTRTCLRWARELDRGWVRNGLLTLVTAFSFNLAFGVLKGTALAARWLGADLDVLSTTAAPPAAGIGAGLGACGFLMPLAGPRLEEAWRAWRAHRRMYPLWRALQDHPDARFTTMRLPLWSPIAMRATQRATQVADGIHDLAPYMDEESRALLERQAEAAGHSAAQARAAAEAALVRSALRARAARRPEDGVPAPAGPAPGSPYPVAAGYEELGLLGVHFARLAAVPRPRRPLPARIPESG